MKVTVVLFCFVRFYDSYVQSRQLELCTTVFFKCKPLLTHYLQVIIDDDDGNH